MKGVIFKWLGILLGGLFVWPLCGIAEEERFAEEQVLSGEASVVLRDIDRGGVSAKFEEYRDFNSVSGELELEYRNKERHFFKIRADNIGEDNQYVGLLGGWYGKLKVGFSYDQIPHKFALGAKTLYSGIGSGNLTLDDGLQTRLQAAPGTIDAEFSNNAVSGDPELSRDIVKLNVDVAAYDPFGLRVEVSREDREGTRPFFGSFGLSNTVEIFEPRDYQTTDVKVAAEYSKRQLFLSAGYNYSSFDNNIDTLTWDNPYRITDANLLGASKGSMDLAPDNQYHNFSVSGSYMDLPLKTRVSATASWGWMMQDDNLVPYTSNTDIGTPALPKQNVDAEVNTSLYSFLFTSRPKDFLRIKGRVRHFEYDNKTEQIRFPGFVSADASYESTPIVNLPTSYKKTKAGLDLGFDVWTKTRLNLSYTFDQTKRTNREVSKQDDHIFSGSIQTSPSPWLDLRAEYDRTDRDTSDYDYDVYLGSGEDLQQLPALRKYTQADMARDRVQFLATVYPSDPFAVSCSFIYGRDDFGNSSYGLLEDKHYIFSVDADYALNERANIYAFYNYEQYENEQKGRGDFDGSSGDVDWDAEGEDAVNTFGGGVRVAVIPGKLNLDLSYSFSDVDGQIDFSTPGAAVPGFTAVDESKLQMFETKLKYAVGKGYSVTVGYLWEELDYDDFNAAGFTHTPSEAILAGTLPEGYNANILYGKISYRF